MGQRQLLVKGLTEAHAMSEPGAIIDLPFRFIDDDWKASPLSWSRKRQDAGRAAAPSDDTRTGRSSEAQYQTEHDQATAEKVDWDEQCLVCLGINP